MWFSGHLLSLLRLKTKFIKFGTTFLVKQAKTLPSTSTSLLLRRKPVQQKFLFQKFKKTIRALRVKSSKEKSIRNSKTRHTVEPTFLSNAESYKATVWNSRSNYITFDHTQKRQPGIGMWALPWNAHKLYLIDEEVVNNLVCESGL